MPADSRTRRSQAKKRTREVARRTRYTDPEIERGLTALALCSGNSRRASALLKRQGLKVPHATLYDWQRSVFPERYAQVREDIMPALRADIAERNLDLATKEADASEAILERMMAQLDEIPARDLAGAHRNVVTSQGIHTDKAAALRGEPTTVIEHRSAREILEGMMECYPGLIRLRGRPIEGEAEELPASTAD